jgi:hypothetical protein
MSEREANLMWAKILRMPRRLSPTQTFIHPNDIAKTDQLERAALSEER